MKKIVELLHDLAYLVCFVPLALIFIGVMAWACFKKGERYTSVTGRMERKSK